MEGRIRLGKIIGRRYRFVDDYKKQTYVGANGKAKQRIIYIGEWVCPLNEPDAYRKIVLISRIAAGVALAAVIAAMFIVPLPIENKWYLPVTAMSLFPLLYAIMGVVKMPNRVKPMERQSFAHSFERAKSASVVCLVFLGIASVVWIVCRILILCGVIAEAQPFSVRDEAFVFFLLLAGAACFLTVRKTKEIKTELRGNASCKPE